MSSPSDGDLVFGSLVGVMLALCFIISLPSVVNAGIMGTSAPPEQSVPPWSNGPAEHQHLLNCSSLGYGIWFDHAGTIKCADDLEAYAKRLREFVAQEEAEEAAAKKTPYLEIHDPLYPFPPVDE